METAPALKSERIKMSHGTRKHFKGRMVARVKVGRKWAASPRSHTHTHGGNSQSRVGYSCDDTKMKAETWKLTPGKYKVQLDRRLQRYAPPARPIRHEAEKVAA